MAVRRLDLQYPTSRLRLPLPANVEWAAPIGPRMFSAALAKVRADKDAGPMAAEVMQLAYTRARTKAEGNPTRTQFRAEISRAASSLMNERAKGRINDNYIDGREAGLVRDELAAALFRYFDRGPAKSKPTPAAELSTRASFRQIDDAVGQLLPLVDAGFRLYDRNADDDGEGLARAFRRAAGDAGISSRGRAALLTALNGATSRGDGDRGPDAAGVKRLLTNAQARLKAADGALIVDFAHPDRKPTSRKDRVTTGLEVDRTPSVTGMTSRAVLAFAATL